MFAYSIGLIFQQVFDNSTTITFQKDKTGKVSISQLQPWRSTPLGWTVSNCSQHHVVSMNFRKFTDRKASLFPPPLTYCLLPHKIKTHEQQISHPSGFYCNNFSESFRRTLFMKIRISGVGDHIGKCGRSFNQSCCDDLTNQSSMSSFRN